MITITLNQIQKYRACELELVKVMKSMGKTKPDDVAFPLTDLLDLIGLDDTLRCLLCLPEYDNLWRKFAWWCADSVAHLNDDLRIRECLDVVWRFSNGEATNNELDVARYTARDAAWAVGGASRDAFRAASGDAARGAARDAVGADAGAAAAGATARDAVRAFAWAAGDAARESARSVSGDAARDVARANQEAKLREILTTGEWV